MHFTWDERKRLQNIRKHGIDFIGVDALFSTYTMTLVDSRYPYEEQRFITFGLLDLRVVTVAHTETSNIIHIISVRKARRHEKEAFFQNSPFQDFPH